MKVAIIGAGIAGLAAARELRKRGVQVTVFEKSRGVGGRLANKRLGWATADIGAQYFTARDARFQKQVALWEQAGAVARWRFTPHSLSASGLTSRVDTTERYVGTPNMNSLAHHLARDVDIVFSTHVSGLHWAGGGWILETDTGVAPDEPYDWVVLSAPAEQSHELANATLLADHIPTAVHEPCWALALATQGNVSSEVQGIFGDNIVSWVSRLSARPERQATDEDWDDVWMLHFSSEWSTRNNKNTASNIEQTGFEWLVSALGNHASEAFRAAHFHPHYWRYARVSNEHEKTGVIASAEHKIAAIGDWAAGGRVEGGYLSAMEFVDYFDANQ